MQADRENPADRWGDGGIQANQTEERKVANQKERLEWSPRQTVKRKDRTKKREVREEEREKEERDRDRG